MERQDFKDIYLPLIALVVGFVGAFITAGVHSLFFMLLPIMAFALGYFSSWRLCILNGCILFVSYIFGMRFMWIGVEPSLLYLPPYIAAFIAGGFSLLLTGALVPMVRKGARRFGSIIALIILTITAIAILAAVVGWLGYSALPRYSYYYQLGITSTQNLENLELYLPVGTVSGEPYKELYSHPYREGPLSDRLTEDFTQELVNTEYGTMLKLAIPNLRKDDVSEPRYTALIFFRQKSAPQQLIQLIPKRDAISINTVSWQRFFGSIKIGENLVVEKFQVPVKITADKQAQIRLSLFHYTLRSESVYFAYGKSDTHAERIDSEIETGDEWVWVPVEVTRVMEVGRTWD